MIVVRMEERTDTSEVCVRWVLGSPEETIKKAHQHNIKVFCDVTDLNFAKKVEALGADAIIAVNNLAGGHRGELTPEVLISLLVKSRIGGPQKNAPEVT